MDRRKLLIGLTSISTSLLAGCNTNDGNETETETQTPTTTPTEQNTTTEETVANKVEQYWVNTGKHLRSFSGHTFVIDYKRTKDGEVDEEIDYELKQDSANRRNFRRSDSTTEGLSVTFADDTGTYLKEVTPDGEESFEVRSDMTYSDYTYMYITEHFLGFLYASDYSNAEVDKSYPFTVIRVSGPENADRDELTTRFDLSQDEITGYTWEQTTDDSSTWFRKLDAYLETSTGYVVESHGEFTNIGETVVEEPEWVTRLKNQETETETSSN